MIIAFDYNESLVFTTILLLLQAEQNRRMGALSFVRNLLLWSILPLLLISFARGECLPAWSKLCIGETDYHGTMIFI